MISASLSFTLRPVASHDDLLRACSVRAEAYGRKNPAYRELMAVPDAVDASPWTAVFLCEDKASGQAVGTMRVQSTTLGNTQLEIEKFVSPPPKIASQGRAEITRLAAVVGADPLVRVAMWKASYQYCMAIGAKWLLMGVRKPSLLRAYELMGARDIFEDCRAVPLGHAGNMPHRVLGLDIGACEENWKVINHPLHDFMFRTTHHDIVFMQPSVQRRRPEEVRLQIA